MDRRRKLTPEQVGGVIAMLDQGKTLDAVARTFGISDSHVHRIKVAHSKGEMKLKPSSLSSCLELIKTGLPFKRTCWDVHFYYYDNDDQSKWFIKVNRITGCEVIWYSLDLTLEDLMAKDWVVCKWETVKDDKRTD
jgi:hypothetical protein